MDLVAFGQQKPAKEKRYFDQTQDADILSIEWVFAWRGPPPHFFDEMQGNQESLCGRNFLTSFFAISIGVRGVHI